MKLDIVDTPLSSLPSPLSPLLSLSLSSPPSDGSDHTWNRWNNQNESVDRGWWAAGMVEADDWRDFFEWRPDRYIVDGEQIGTSYLNVDGVYGPPHLKNIGALRHLL